jgi:hypothetical protein
LESFDRNGALASTDWVGSITAYVEAARTGRMSVTAKALAWSEAGISWE